jgi:hypothetical protein
MRFIAITLLTLAIALPAQAQSVASPDLWRDLAQHLPAGAAVKVRLNDGQKVRATLVRASEDTMTLLPKTRIAVPPQEVRYDAVQTLEPEKGGGMSAGKAAAIGISSGVGAFFGIMVIMFAAFAD